LPLLIGLSLLSLNGVVSLLTLPFADLCQVLQGSGKAKMMWESLRIGADPLTTEVGATGALSEKARALLVSALHGTPLIKTAISLETLSDCGTRKLLQTCTDGQSIESVLIPSHKFDRTTLCVSTQLGCDRGCAFCLTGTMGLIRNLTSEEIVSQVFNGLQVVKREKMPALTNIVFMGMGDSGRNMKAVGEAVACLADRERMCMAQSKITISTVGPSPEAFMELAAMPGTLAWSLHAADDAIRKRLVPSTRHTTVQLRDGLMAALATRPALRTRTIMVALTLIDGINDSIEDAQKLADFIRPALAVAPKIALDLIPYNDISVPGFVRPSREKVNAFQAHLREQGFFCSVRVTRGDEESSACGMLATKRLKKSEKKVLSIASAGGGGGGGSSGGLGEEAVAEEEEEEEAVEDLPLLF